MKKSFTKKVILNSIHDLLIKSDRFRIKHGMTKGFTLAEVLITLGVIGVVAAITMPILIQNYNKKVWATNLKKAYSTASQACNFAMAKDGVNDIGDTEFFESLHNESDFENVAKRYFTNAKIKKLSSAPTDYYAYNNGSKLNSTITWDNKYSIELPDITYYISTTASDPRMHAGQLQGSYTRNINFYVDVNGANKKPNIVGKDFYAFYFNQKCSNDIATHSHYLSNNCGRHDFVMQPMSCFNKVMQDNWEIKYDIK